jgi:hypothetical protein
MQRKFIPTLVRARVTAELLIGSSWATLYPSGRFHEIALGLRIIAARVQVAQKLGNNTGKYRL